MGSLKRTLIPRKTLNARQITQTLDVYNYPSEVSVNITLDSCTAQPVNGYEQQTLPEGYRDKVVYRVFTSTEVLPRIEGSDTSYQIEVRSGVWCDVISVKVWEVGVQSHYEVLAAEPNER